MISVHRLHLSRSSCICRLLTVRRARPVERHGLSSFPQSSEQPYLYNPEPSQAIGNPVRFCYQVEALLGWLPSGGFAGTLKLLWWMPRSDLAGEEGESIVKHTSRRLLLESFYGVVLYQFTEVVVTQVQIMSRPYLVLSPVSGRTPPVAPRRTCLFCV